MIAVLLIDGDFDSIYNVSHGDKARHGERSFEAEWDDRREEVMAARDDDPLGGHDTDDILQAMICDGWNIEPCNGEVAVVHD